MLTFQAHLIQVTQNLIREEIEMKKNGLVTAHINLDFAGYKYHVGLIQGLQRALELIEEAETMINTGERG